MARIGSPLGNGFKTENGGAGAQIVLQGLFLRRNRMTWNRTGTCTCTPDPSHPLFFGTIVHPCGQNKEGDGEHRHYGLSVIIGVTMEHFSFARIANKESRLTKNLNDPRRDVSIVEIRWW